MRSIFWLSVFCLWLIAASSATAETVVSVSSSGTVREYSSYPDEESSNRRARGQVWTTSINHKRSISEGATQDPAWNYPWWLEHLTKVRAVTAWPMLARGEGAVVAVIDTGVDPAQPDLASQLVAGWDFVDKDADPSDPNGHGTHVAGTIAAQADNQLGTVGVMPAVKIMPLRALDKSGSGTDADIIRAIIYASNHGAHAINLSIGGSEPSAALSAALEYALKHGVALSCAAGNGAIAQLEWPAADPACLPVRASSSWHLTEWSNYGPSSDGRIRGVSAPGEEIWSTLPGISVAPMSGTSMATPQVTAALGVLVQRGMSPQQAYQIVQSSAMDMGEPGADARTGYGQLDLTQMAYAATGSAPMQCPLQQMMLGPGHTQQQAITMCSELAGASFEILRAPSARWGKLQLAGAELSFRPNSVMRWRNIDTQALIRVVDHPEMSPFIVAIKTNVQAVRVHLERHLCGQQVAKACTVSRQGKMLLALRLSWRERRSYSSGASVLVVRSSDQATQSWKLKRAAVSPYLYRAALARAEFDPGIYQIIPRMGQLHGETLWLRVTA